jgi:ABC-2 type transport system ATP-binding protein
MTMVDARNLHKSYADVHALAGFDLTVEPGRIVGLIGPNGSGKTTALKAILGLNAIDEGTIEVLGLDPYRQRAAMMESVAYIADTGILPGWMRVCDLLDYVQGVHARFDRAGAEARLASTEIHLRKPVRVLSKGMHVQLHLAIILAIDARLLVLDEPTLGLDILYRQQFYDGVLNDYFSDERSIVITTHEVREIEHILTDVVFIHKGSVCLSLAMSDLDSHYLKLTTSESTQMPVEPMSRHTTLNGTEYIFQGVERAELAGLGVISTPNLAELFVATVGETT